MKILIVSSDRHLLEALNRFFINKKIKTLTAFDGVIASNEFEDDIDLVIVDESIPRITPDEFISRLKKRKENLKTALIINSYYVNKELLIANNNVDEYIAKPFSDNELEFLLEQLNKEKEYCEVFLTYKEQYLFNQMKKGKIDLNNINKSLLSFEEINEYEKALLSKMKAI